MGSFGKERNGVREVTADALDHRKASENQQGNEKPTLTGVVPVAMRTMSMPMSMSMLVVVPTSVRMRRRCAADRVLVIAVVVIAVVVIAVVVVRVRHGLRKR